MQKQFVVHEPGMFKYFFMNLNYVKIVVWLCSLLVLPAVALSDKLNDQRQIFLQAEKYLSKKNEVGFLALSESLTDYPLFPYLKYQWLKDHTDQTDQVLAFLSTYKDTRYASSLRSKLLDYLAENERWNDFVKHYEVTEDSADDCQFLWAQYQTGKQQQALGEAKRLWILGKSTETKCQPLFSALANSSLLTSDLIWQRFESALVDNNLGVAQSTVFLLKQIDRKSAELWL